MNTRRKLELPARIASPFAFASILLTLFYMMLTDPLPKLMCNIEIAELADIR